MVVQILKLWMVVALGVDVEVSSCRRLGFGFRCWHSILACSSVQSSGVVDCDACSLEILKRAADQQLWTYESAQEAVEEGDASKATA